MSRFRFELPAELPAKWFCVLVLLSCLSVCTAQDASQDDARFWTSAGGKRSTVRLSIVDQDADSVKLQRSDNGKLLTLQIKDLSRADQDFLAQRAQPQKTPSRQAASAEPSGNQSSNWARFRGPNGSGVSSDTGLPTRWTDSENSDDQNIVWKTPLKGRGSSSPITWGDHIYLTAYTGYGVEADVGELSDLKYHMLCFNRNDGKLIWEQEVRSTSDSTPYGPGVQYHGYATSTPCADESGVYVMFGTTGLVCFSHDGQQKWLEQKGDYLNQYGDGSSPILFNDMLLIQDVTGEARTIGVNKNTGETVWRVNDMGGGWQTPIMMETSNGPEMIISRRTWGLAGVNPMTGDMYWTAGNTFNMSAIPVPIHHGNTVFMTGGRNGLTFSFEAGGKGKLTELKTWELDKGSEMSSPVYHDGYLYLVRDRGGIAYCINASTGELVYEERLSPNSEQNYASAVLADGKIYYVSRKKGTHVIAAKPEFEQLGHNKFESDNGIFNATPAISEGKLLIRSDNFLYCIGAK